MHMKHFGSILLIATMASRGGARRGPTPAVGPGALSDAFDEIAAAKKTPFDFGSYEHLTRSQAVSGRGLAANGFVIRSLAKIAPAGEIQHLELKHQFIIRASHNKSQLKNELWAGMRADR